ncbi:hypothetical protein PVAG01_04411 [Phlyctema vagabunda]|uniref:G-protein coupled receptors family 1 profile domain-containing protein n=1 Tax=Phlyctema vagabunda TaxID=108571 RepID=A0ABR4PP82_9HELO
MGIDGGLVAANLTGSLLSILGTTFILVCYIILPQKRHIRHALITNLTIADFINAVNNASSGLWVVANKRALSASPGCTANGFIGQLSIQAVDCSILIITVVTLFIVTSSKSTADFSLRTIILFCAAAWILPIITSCIALGRGYYGPASSNWCWIQERPIYLRYIFTHGWRFVFIAIIAAICIYIQIYIYRHIRKMNEMSYGTSLQNNTSNTLRDRRRSSAKVDYSVNYQSDSHEPMVGLALEHSTPEGSILKTDSIVPGSPRQSFAQHWRSSFVSVKREPQIEVPAPAPGRSRSQQNKMIQKAMLLHAYPILYIILWIPGISMRIVQATGGKSYALSVLQASTQFIGFANALTFGWNERIGRQLRNKFSGQGKSF